MKYIKKIFKNRFPLIYNMWVRYKQDKYYKYLKSLDESEYPEELKKIYFACTGEKLEWENLRSYTEKMQWAKLYDKDTRKTILSDKYLVREWVKNLVAEEYLIPLFGVWNSFDEIDFDLLPDKFVLKTNHGSGTNYFVKDKTKFNKEEAKQKFDKWMKINYAFVNGLEMQYKDIKPKIIAEQYMEDDSGDLKDFKFICFEGKVKYCWVDIDRYSDHKRNVFDTEWNLQNWQQHTYKNTDYSITKPDKLSSMLEIAEKLAYGFSHVRVDLYIIKENIYFGEMTFTNGSGFELICPKEYNLKLGDMWKLSI